MPAADRLDAMRPAGLPVRLARSVAAALVCVLAAGTGHLTAGGRLAPTAVAAVFVVGAAITWSLAGRRVTPTQLVGLLVLCQVGVHLTSAHGEMSMGAAMISGHAAATVLSVVALSLGERFVWALAERLGLHVVPLLRSVRLPTWQRPALPVVVLRSLRDVRLTHSLWSRGPPVGLV